MKDLKVFSDLDYKILAFVLKNGTVTFEQIQARFKSFSALENRVEILSEPYQATFGVYVPNTSVIVPIVKDNTLHYQITDYGKRVLQVYKLSSKKRKKEIWLKNMWIPIIVSFVTYMLLNYIAPMILNSLKQLCDILQNQP